MKRISLCIVALLICFASFGQFKLIEKVGKTGDELVIPYSKYQLPNGLTVILHEDNSDPLVHVDVTYHVGSAREELGKSGFAHFFEHMMFQGSDNVADEQHFKIITEAGGTLNGTTNKDRTNYFETVPSNQLEKMLWLEADRMGFLLDAVTQKKFEIQRATVKNERGQNYDNRPYGLVGEFTSKNLYPKGHPYSWLTIGYVEDLNRVNVEDLKNFFLRWYGPNNATLTVGGDIDVEQTLKWISKYYASIPRGPEVDGVKLDRVSMKSDRYVSLTDAYAKMPMLSMVLPSVPNYHPDEAPLDCLANILGGSKSSVMHQRLVKTKKALMARVSNPCYELAGEFKFTMISPPGKPLAELEAEVRQIIQEFGERGPSDEEIQRFRNEQEASMIFGLESVRGKVSQLASYQTFTGDANYLPKDLKRYTSITKADVMRVFKKYIQDKPMVIVSLLTKGNEAMLAADDNYFKPDSEVTIPDYGYDKLVYNKAKDNFNRGLTPPSAKAPAIKVPEVDMIEKKGVKFITSASNELPTVFMYISMKGGRMTENSNLQKMGLSSMFSTMMNEDTKTMSAEAISDELANLGSSVRVSAGLDNITFSVRSLRKNLNATLDILEKRMFEPEFKESTFKRKKFQALQGIKNSKTRASTVASDAYRSMLYGKNNVLGYPSNGTEETVANIEFEDIQKYYDDYVSRTDLQVIMVGDIRNGDRENVLGRLKPLKYKDVEFKPIKPLMSLVGEKTLYVVDIPEAAQTEFRVGGVTNMKYDATGEYFKAGLMNYALGGAFNSRLNLNLREDKGWTYGARARFSSNDYSGTYTFGSGIKVDNTAEALAEVVKEIENYTSEGMTNEELAFMKSAISQSDARKYETPRQKASLLSNMVKRDLPISYVDEQSEIVDKITKDELDNLAKKWLNLSKMTIVFAGDLEKIKPSLEGMGYKVIQIDSNGERVEKQEGEIIFDKKR